LWQRQRQIKKNEIFCFFWLRKRKTFSFPSLKCNSQAAKKGKIILKRKTKESTSFCELKEAKKL